MKKLILLIVLFLSFITMPVVLAKDNVSINSVTVDSKSDKAEVINDAIYDGLSINFDVKFFGVNDYVKYKVIIDNPTNKDYEITSNSDLNLGEYVSYDYRYGDDSNIIKKNSQMTMYINIKYNKEVPSNLFKNGLFNQRDNLTIDLGNDNSNNIVNPKTSNYILIFVIMLLIIGISIVVFNPLRNKKYYSFIIIGLLLLPISIYAIEKLQINIDSNVVISNSPKFCYTYEGQSYYYEFEEGMTWGDFINSNYNDNRFDFFDNNRIIVSGHDNHDMCCVLDEDELSDDNSYSELLVSSDNGCYTLYNLACK